MVNFEQWVVDGRGNPVPMGIAGKLYVGGIGVARGYHDRPELKAERFVTLPWAADPAALLPQRRPGDVAVQRLAGLSRPYRPEVKLHGFRIELGEIESALRRHADVGNAVVAVREPRTGQRQLAAYVFPATLRHSRNSSKATCAVTSRRCYRTTWFRRSSWRSTRYR